ncbi:polysaccharide deacetylase family protein [Pandoraea sp. PE-S2T-3]|uniref:polysaccharide deacetylase family protein n=1 Tax=Pandoraea sp. PE-S2T-3 TaxID=1986993 RepID=UPI000B402177|nr:polysaccharide deacetylase family protein [Pandoraea sp. PE-S2T-3]
MRDTTFEIALTVDDIPSHGPTTQAWGRTLICHRVLEAFSLNSLPPVVGFANCKPAAKTPEQNQILHAWVQAGNLLGNHTFRHSDIREVSTKEFIDDIARNSRYLKRFEATGSKRYFRFPFLLEGESEGKFDAVQAYLRQTEHIIAPVTVDFLDFLWNVPVAECADANNSSALSALRHLYVASAMQKILHARKTSIALYGRNIKHIMLVHAGIATAHFLGDVIKACADISVTFTSLDRALCDPVYHNTPVFHTDSGRTFLHQSALVAGMDMSDHPSVPRSLIQSMSPSATNHSARAKSL